LFETSSFVPGLAIDRRAVASRGTA